MLGSALRFTRPGRPADPSVVTRFLARRERFDHLGSTNDVVRDWLAEGTAEVCLAVADQQTAGRGRRGRTWTSPAGTGLLLSLGFRPTWLEPAQTWRLSATVSLAMARAAETVGGLADGAIRLKWPNDLVIETRPARPTAGLLAAPTASGALAAGQPNGAGQPDGIGVRKLAGVLGESEGLGSDDPCAVVGLGINTDWTGVEIPPDLAGSMTSLRHLSAGRPIDRTILLAGFLERLEPAIEGLRRGRFEAVEWQRRQLTTGRLIRLEQAEGSRTVRAAGVDVATGALVIDDPDALGRQRTIFVGEISHVRLADPAMAGV